ncbi:MAG TPA: YbaK/EbsC family protein [Propionicimonas sp.]|nr:YbaK/EbsC family protein [Propionicimonas sp.]HRA07486.1 YbaK/EbsC family protein [Propionicimonas sp.]
MDTSTPEPQAPAEAALRAAGVSFRVVRHRRASSLAEAAALRGVEPRDIIKTLVVRRASDDFVFVLVPGDREISWPKLRAALGVNRLSLPDAATAFGATGYERGTITPFGSSVAWPVVADASVAGRLISLGAGEHGATVLLEADAALAALGAQVMDISGPLA